jgi:hypothetical protein
MYRRLREFERRLARLSAVLNAWSGNDERQRRQRETHKVLAAMLRAGLESAGIDPDEVSALRRLETPEPAPPSEHPLRRLAQRQQPRTFLDVICDLTRRFHTMPPDLHGASAAHLIGYYCFGDGAARAAPA